MKDAVIAQATEPRTPTIQRKCACGSSGRDDFGQCNACEEKKRLQTKLRLGSPRDPLEAEADRIADRLVQSRSAGDIPISPLGGKLRRATAGTSAEGLEDRGLEQRLHSESGRGTPLDAASRHQKLGHARPGATLRSGAHSQRRYGRSHEPRSGRPHLHARQ